MVWPRLRFLSAYSFMHWITKNGAPLGFPSVTSNKRSESREIPKFLLPRIISFTIYHFLQYVKRVYIFQYICTLSKLPFVRSPPSPDLNLYLLQKIFFLSLIFCSTLENQYFKETDCTITELLLRSIIFVEFFDF